MRFRDLFRLSWVSKPKAERHRCRGCWGTGLTYLDGTPALEETVNTRQCGSCTGMGFHTVVVDE